MRVLWVSHLLPYPPKGGVQQRSFNLLREVSSRHEVALVSFFQKAHQPEPALVDEAVQAFGAFCKVHEVLSIPCDRHRFGKPMLAARSLLTGAAYSVEWLREPAFAAAVERAALAHSPDVVHFDTISLAQYRKVPGVGGVPAVLNHHNVESHMLIRRGENESHPLRSAYFRTEGRRLEAYEKRVGREFELHVGCSAIDRDRLAALMPGTEVDVVPNGVDLDYFHPQPDAPKVPRSMVFAGRLSWYPNDSAMRMFLKDVWPLLSARVADASLTIIGKGASAPLLAAARGDDRIEVTGFVPDVRPYIDASEVYVCPIFDGGGTKLKILDALAMGAAIVAHPVACEGIDVTDGKDVLLAETPQAMCAAIERLFAEPSLAASLRSHALELARAKYSFKSIGAHLCHLYERTAATKKRHA